MPWRVEDVDYSEVLFCLRKISDISVSQTDSFLELLGLQHRVTVPYTQLGQPGTKCSDFLYRLSQEMFYSTYFRCQKCIHCC